MAYNHRESCTILATAFSLLQEKTHLHHMEPDNCPPWVLSWTLWSFYIWTHTRAEQSSAGTCGLLPQEPTSPEDVQYKKHGRVGDNWMCLFKNKINNWHIHTFGSQKQGRSTDNFPCTFVTSRWHVVILWWDFEVTCSFKTWDWNKLLRAERFLPVVFRVRQAGCRERCAPLPHQALKKAQLWCSLH